MSEDCAPGDHALARICAGLVDDYLYAAAIGDGGILGERLVAPSRAGAAILCAWASCWRSRRWVVDVSTHAGQLLAGALEERGDQVVALPSGPPAPPGCSASPRFSRPGRGYARRPLYRI
jgi:hypothetical protein